jgi:translation initiation factor 3 subunit L
VSTTISVYQSQLIHYARSDSEGPVQLELPEQWLWDIIDEFIYQFQVFCTWRSKVKSKTDDELVMLAEGGPVSAFFIVFTHPHYALHRSGARTAC